MGKVLTWIVIGLLLWLGWRLLVISKRRSNKPADESSSGEGQGSGAAHREEPADSARMPGPERMVQCAVCGLHLPASEGRFAAGKVYCSEAHRDQASAASGAAQSPDERSRRH